LRYNATVKRRFYADKMLQSVMRTPVPVSFGWQALQSGKWSRAEAVPSNERVFLAMSNLLGDHDAVY
jgi:hypothetical protein